MKKLSKKDIDNPLFKEALYNVVQRGVRDIKEQKDGYRERVEDTIKDLKTQRILMEKFQHALIFNRVRLEILFQK